VCTLATWVVRETGQASRTAIMHRSSKSDNAHP
jgi:hypothetical protein